MYRIEKEPSAAEAKFNDVPSGIWYEKAVAWACENGIVSGVSDTEFQPDAFITREQAALILYRYAKFKGYKNSFAPKNNITIAQAAAVFTKLSD